ncbi:MAG TPA: hypothetical protein VGQ36_08035 [Thermoanaerobaculia bacterium]|nr:hypothetical protein [Thermoanaerobaculia bacterium]
MKILILCILASSVLWEPPRRFRGPFPGHLELPPGYVVYHIPTLDSQAGEVEGPDHFTLRFDIGHMAGTHMFEARKSECQWFLQHTVGEQRAFTGVVESNGKRQIMTTVMTEPSTIPANFSAMVRSEKDVALFLTIVATYRQQKAGSANQTKPRSQ